MDLHKSGFILLTIMILAACGTAYTLRNYQEPVGQTATVIFQMNPNYTIDVNLHQTDDCSTGGGNALGSVGEKYIGSISNNHKFQGRKYVEFNDELKFSANQPVALTADLFVPGPPSNNVYAMSTGTWYNLKAVSFVPKSGAVYKITIDRPANTSNGIITIFYKNHSGKFEPEKSAIVLDERC